MSVYCFSGVNEITTAKQANQNQNKQLTRLCAGSFCLFRERCLGRAHFHKIRYRREKTIDVDFSNLYTDSLNVYSQEKYWMFYFGIPE